MSGLPDYHKISFADMPPTPMEEVVPDASPEVRHILNYLVLISAVLNCFVYFEGT